MKTKLFLSALLLFTFIAISLQLHADVTSGSPAPDFMVPNTDQKNVNLSSFKGKFVVLEWFNHDCPFVKKHYESGNMQSLQKEYTEKGVVWLSINSSAEGKEGYVNAEEAVKQMQEKNAVPSQILLDSEGHVGKLYGAKTTPHMYIINPEGNLIYQGAIDDKPGTEISEIASSKNYVRQALEEALSGSPVSEPTTKSYGCSVKY